METLVQGPCATFRAYAWSSVRVDKYFATVRIFARHYDALKAAASALPSRAEWPDDFSCLTEQARKFFIAASGGLNYMGTTGIFLDEPSPELANLPRDTISYASVTCYSFQWNLFETFVTSHVLDAVRDGLFPADVSAQLRAAARSAGRLLARLNTDDVFGHTPFRTVLEVPGWIPSFETCGFNDLDEIRRTRNRLVHAATEREFLDGGYDGIEGVYDRSMWILRKFAENVENDIEALRGTAIGGA